MHKDIIRGDIRRQRGEAHKIPSDKVVTKVRKKHSIACLTGIAKSVFIRYPAYDAMGLIKKIQPYQYISFDIFDTLVKRAAPSPEDVFRIMIERFNQSTGEGIHREDFVEARMTAEESARRTAQQHGREEITLREIYACLPVKYDMLLREKLMRLEIAQEKSCSHANPIMQQVYQWCLEQKKHIFITSDMYLPLDTIEEILSQCGYALYDRLFLSSDIGLTKTSGNLFDYIISDTQITPSALIHVGDSPRGDYLSAKRHGIKTIRIARHANQTKFTRLFAMSRRERRVMAPLAKVMNNLIDPAWDAYCQFGFEVVGPLLYGFCTWLHDTAIEQGVEKLYFLARDGYLLQKGYQQLHGANAISNKYLYASRRAFHTPQFWIDPSLSGIVSMQPLLMRWNCELLCKELGISVEEGISVWEQKGLEKTKQFSTQEMLLNTRIEDFFNEVKPCVVDNSKHEFQLLIEYLQQNGLSGKAAIVDLGWHGSLQKCLNSILDKTAIEVDLSGYYLGLNISGRNGLRAKAFISNQYPDAGTAALAEFFFSSQEGSARAFIRNMDNTIVPALLPYEYLDRIESEYRRSIQKGALIFLQTVKEYLAIMPADDALWANLRIAIRQPRRRELDMFADLLVYERELLYLAVPQSIWHYILHPKDFMKDMMNSCWRIGFLKRLFKLPLPYDKAILLIRYITQKGTNSSLACSKEDSDSG